MRVITGSGSWQSWKQERPLAATVTPTECGLQQGCLEELAAKKLGVANFEHNAVALSLGRHENKHSGLR